MAPPNRKAVIVDIDGTLADNRHRRHLVDHKNYAASGKKNWEEFKRLASYDTVVRPIRRLVRELWRENHVVLCTGRSEDQREQTRIWLIGNGVPYSHLFMRADGDYRPDPVVKREMLDKVREHYDPWLVLDDRNSVVAMWRDAGLTCLQVAPGDF